MTEKNDHLYNRFLNHLCQTKEPATLFLLNGVKLQGIVVSYDDMAVVLRRDAHEQLVFKHALSTIMPHNPIELSQPSGTDPNA